MKTISILILAVIVLSAATIRSNDGNAKADKLQGLDVYVYSEPTRDYEVIESGKVMFSLTGGCPETVSQSAKKAAKLGAHGVIVHLESNKWDAIKYKE